MWIQFTKEDVKKIPNQPGGGEGRGLIEPSQKTKICEKKVIEKSENAMW